MIHQHTLLSNKATKCFQLFSFFFYIFFFKQAFKCCQKKVLFSFGLKPQHNTLWIRTIPTTVSMVCYMYTIIHQHTCLLNKHQNVELCLLFNWSTIILPTFGLPQFVFVQHHISFLLFTWHQPQKSGVSKPHKLADKRCFQPRVCKRVGLIVIAAL